MKFSIAIVGALATLGLAKPAITNTEFELTEGKPYTLEWISANGPVLVELVSGPDSLHLLPVRTLAPAVTTGSLTFTPSGLPSGNYAFRVTDNDKDPNFSVLFQYKGTGVVSSASSGSASASASSTKSATSTTSGVSSAPASSGSTTSASSTSSRTSTTSSTRTAATTTSTNTPANNNEGQRFSSPLALVFMTVAALVFFN